MRINSLPALSSLNPFKNSWKERAKNAGIELTDESIQVIPHNGFVRLTKEEKVKAVETLKDVGFVWFRNVLQVVKPLVDPNNLERAIRYFQYRTTLDLGNELRRRPNNPLTNEGEILIPNATGTANKTFSEWAHFDSDEGSTYLRSIGYGPISGILRNARLTLWNLRDSVFCGKKFIRSSQLTVYIRPLFLLGIRSFTISDLNPNEYPFVVLIDGLDWLAHSTTRIVIDQKSKETKRPISRIYLEPYKASGEPPNIFRYTKGTKKDTLRLNKEKFLNGEGRF